MGTEWMVKAQRTQPDGRELFLVQDTQGVQRLWIFRPVGKNKVRLEILRRLKEAVTSNPPDIEGYFPLLNVHQYGDGIALEVRYDIALWEGWEGGLSLPATPEATAHWLRCVLETLAVYETMEIPLHIIHPVDLLPLTSGVVGLLDPRISAAIAETQPLNPPREFYYPPEVLERKPWTKAATLYSVGLNAYMLLSGSYPFEDEEKAEVTRRILQEKPIDIRFLAPQTSEAFAQLIMKLVFKEATERPTFSQVAATVEALEAGGARAEEDEQQSFKEQSERAVGKREKRRRFKRFWRWGRWGAAALVFIMVGLMVAKPGYKPVLTPKTTPRQVVDYYYKAIADLDALLLDEMLAKDVGKDIEDMVTWSFVTSRYDPSGEGRKVLVINDLQVKPETISLTEAHFSSSYTLEKFSAKIRIIQRRSERLTLRRVKKVWQIVDVDVKILSEEETKLEEAEGRSKG